MDEKLDWFIDGRQDFKFLLHNEIEDKSPGAVIQSADVTVQRRTGVNPERWTQVAGVTPAVTSIVADDFDTNNPIAANGVYIVMDPVVGSIVKGLPYRFYVKATLNTNIDVFATPQINVR